LTDEIQTNMRLLGATSLDQLGLRTINTRLLEQEIVSDLEQDGENPRARI
jgi:hypothetical protein